MAVNRPLRLLSFRRLDPSAVRGSQVSLRGRQVLSRRQATFNFALGIFALGSPRGRRGGQPNWLAGVQMFRSSLAMRKEVARGKLRKL
jgi:hypothetical protein